MFELNDVDVVAFLIDATKPIGRGDAWVAERVKNARSKKVLVLTKADEADPAQVMEQLKAAHELMEYDDEIVTSSVKNFNVDAFIETVVHFLPEGPRWFPEGMGTELPMRPSLPSLCARRFCAARVMRFRTPLA